MKLINQIKNSFSGLNKVLSLSVMLSEDDAVVSGGIYKLQGGEVDLSESIDQLKLKEVVKTTPICLTLEGKGILHKFVELEVSKIRLRNIIPNIKEEDFYINYTPQSNGTWVSLIRKDLVSKTLGSIGVIKENIIDLYIGTSCIQLLNGVVDELPNQIGNSIFTFDNAGLKSIEKVEGGSAKSQSLFGNTLEPKFHLSMVGAVISLNSLNSLKSQNWQDNTSSQKQKKTFYSTVKLCLGLLLFIFMGNMVLNQVLKSKHDEINNEFNQQKGLVNMVEKLQSEAAEKNEFITQLGLEQNPQFALFVDEIGMTVPNSIQLGDLNINPLTKSIRKKKVIDFKNGYINIGGFCKSSQICNEWVTVLRKLNWAEKVELVDFKINKENIGEFNIEVSF